MLPLFVFEGPDEVGKTTLVSAIQEELQERGFDCATTSFPGREKGTLGHLIYEIHHCPERFGLTSLPATSLQLLHIAAHIDAIGKHIAPLLKAGKMVLLDRFWWSTWAYGTVSGIPEQQLDLMLEVERLAWGSIQPSIVFLVDRPAAGAPKDLLAAYERLAAKGNQGCRVVRLDNSRPPALGAADAIELILGTLEPENHPSLFRDSPPSFENGQALGSRTSSTTCRPLVFTSLEPAVPTKVYDTYWRFAAERQAIFFRKLRRAPGLLTQDPILLRHKFTNAYRASDRVSQFLIREVIYGSSQTVEEVFFRTVLFKLFNRIETWQLLNRSLGPVRYADFHFDQYDAVLTRALEAGQRIYSAAYIMPVARAFGPTKRKHRTHLRLLERLMSDDAPARLARSHSMREAFELLRSFPMLGDFLAYQLMTDLNYSQILDFSEMEFIVAGPGAKDGIHKCFRYSGGLSEADLIRLVADRQEAEFERLGIEFQTLWGRRLQLIDCQNLFCEVGKYARLAHPDVDGISGRTRIKQLYRPSEDPIRYWYPPKWGINDAVERDLSYADAQRKGVP